MADLIPATDYVAVFSRLDSDGETQFHSRPLICWTVGADGLAVGQYLNHNGRIAIASEVVNFSKYAQKDEWENESMRLALRRFSRREAEETA